MLKNHGNYFIVLLPEMLVSGFRNSVSRSEFSDLGLGDPIKKYLREIQLNTDRDFDSECSIRSRGADWRFEFPRFLKGAQRAFLVGVAGAPLLAFILIFVIDWLEACQVCDVALSHGRSEASFIDIVGKSEDIAKI